MVIGCLSYCVGPPPGPFGALAYSGHIILQNPVHSAFEHRILSMRQVQMWDTCKNNFKIVTTDRGIEKLSIVV